MEAAASSCSILHPLRSSSNYHSKHYTETPPRNSSSSSCCNNLYLGLPFSSTFLRNYTFPGKFVQQNLFTTFCLTPNSSKQNPSTEFAVLLEVDGYVFSPSLFLFFFFNCSISYLLFLYFIIIIIYLIIQKWIIFSFFRVLIDAYRLGNRRAFNVGAAID